MSKQKLPFYCFSPPVMIATFAIEILLAIYTLFRYRRSSITKLGIAMLVCLATFQLAEYFVCGGSQGPWARVGYVAITMLPVLGIHLLYLIAKKPVGTVVTMAYATAVACIAYFLVSPEAFVGQECTGNYVIFQIGMWQMYVYSLFYFGWIAFGFYKIYGWQKELNQKQSKSNQHRRRALLSFALGYLVFIVPTALAITIEPDSKDAIPSVMCGFAVIFAFLLTGSVLPEVERAELKK